MPTKPRSEMTQEEIERVRERDRRYRAANLEKARKSTREHIVSDVDLLATVPDPSKLDLPALAAVQGEMSIACRAAVNLVLLGVDPHSLVCVCRFHPDLLGHITPDLRAVRPTPDPDHQPHQQDHHR